MASIHVKNRRYRSLETMVTDVVEVLGSNLSYGTKHAVLSDVFWVWTEFDGKYHGCRYWSERALKRYSRKSVKGLRHEHIVPKSVLIDLLLRHDNPAEESVGNLLKHFCIGVVVTVDEDNKLNSLGLRSSMPDDWDESNPLARYQSAGIAWVDRLAQWKSVLHGAGTSAISVGVDRCKKGWFTVARGNEEIGGRIFATFSDLVADCGEESTIAVDTPIGLLDSYPRECEVEARRAISPRSSSVFGTPVREVFDLDDYPSANQRHKQLTGKGVSKQAFAIFPPIREIDKILTTQSVFRERIFEVHPEVSFWAANGCQALTHAKKTSKGISQRRSILRSVFGIDHFPNIRSQFLKSEAADDDILDALAALWTAERIGRGKAMGFPQQPQFDRYDIRAAIWY